MIAEADCILANRERAALVGAGLEWQMEKPKWIVSKGKSYSSVEEHAVKALLLVTEGARVVIGDVLEQEGRQLASELGGAATFVRHDVTQEGIGKQR